MRAVIAHHGLTAQSFSEGTEANQLVRESEKQMGFRGYWGFLVLFFGHTVQLEGC